VKSKLGAEGLDAHLERPSQDGYDQAPSRAQTAAAGTELALPWQPATARELPQPLPSPHGRIAFAVHIFAVLAALVAVIGMFAVTRSLSRPGSCLIGQAAVVSATAACRRLYAPQLAAQFLQCFESVWAQPRERWNL
jgi:hypothetical protein